MAIKIIDTESSDAETIFNDWINYPDSAGEWQLTDITYNNETKKVIQTTKNEAFTGYRNPERASEINIKTKLNVMAHGDNDVLGIAFRINKKPHGDSDNPYVKDDKGRTYSAYDMYVFMFDRSGIRGTGLFKIKNAPYDLVIEKDKNDRRWTGRHNTGWVDGTYYFHQNLDEKTDLSTTNIITGIGTFSNSLVYNIESGVPIQSYKSFDKNSPIPDTVSGYIKALQRSKNKLSRDNHKWYDVEVSAIKNRIKVWVDGNLEIDYIDDDDPLLEGGFGPMASSQSHATFMNFEAEYYELEEDETGDDYGDDDDGSGDEEEEEPSVHKVVANFKEIPFNLYIDIEGPVGSTEPINNKYHFFRKNDSQTVNIYPFPSYQSWKSGDDVIPPRYIFSHWSGDLDDEQDIHSIPLSLEMNQDREITAHFTDLKTEDGIFILSSLKDSIQWYLSLHDGYFYKNLGDDDD